MAERDRPVNRPQLGGQTPAPLNAPPTGPLGYGVQPGTTLGVIIARLVEIFGAMSGLFVYNPIPGAGNLTESIAAVGGTDIYHNTYFSGFNVYGSNGQRVGLQIAGFGPQVGFFSGATSEQQAAALYQFTFNRGLANEQLDLVFSGPESTASPIDYVSMSALSSAANSAGGAFGQFAYGQNAGTPAALVQTSPSGTSTGGSSITLTLGAGTTAGNCVIVMIDSDGSGADPTVSGVTLGGAAGNFASAVTSPGSGNTRASIWADPNCTGAQTSIVVSFTGGTGSQHCSAIAQEWSGLALTAVTDQTSGNGANAGTSFTSGATGGTTVAGEIAIGMVASSSSAPTFTGPASPWTNLAQINNGGVTSMVAGYMSISGIGTATYSGTQTPSSGYTAVVATFKPAAASTSTNLSIATWQKTGWNGLLVAKNVSTVPASSPAVAETWHNFAFSNSFTAGTPTPQYQYEAVNGGRVRFRGQVTAATAVAGTTWATLPVGYRPATGPNTYISTNNLSGTAGLGGTFQVATSGACTIVPASTSGNVFDLDGTTFPLD